MALNRIMALLVRDKQLGTKIVPIVPDEARTFGMEGIFRQLGIYCASGQLYQPEDSAKVV
jgi:pyruvate dehydrogenase E1 component